MTISVTVVADSVSREGKRITTLQLRYPRFIHAEFMTHRVFSRNASSSRAIPVKRIIEDIMTDPAIPIHWGKNIPGMQAHEQIDEQVAIGSMAAYPDGIALIEDAEVSKETAWLFARDQVIKVAQAFDNAGYHKQIVNRLLEPWSHINVLVTATDFANFSHLRSHPDAQPEIRILSDKMKLAMQQSKPMIMDPGQWHMPYIRSSDVTAIYHHLKYGRITLDEPKPREVVELALKVSVARCARVSYLTHGGRETEIQEDLLLYQRLLGSSPLHASPAEHQATPDAMTGPQTIGGAVWDNPDRQGNFVGWIQYRKTLPFEAVNG